MEGGGKGEGVGRRSAAICDHSCRIFYYEILVLLLTSTVIMPHGCYSRYNV